MPTACAPEATRSKTAMVVVSGWHASFQNHWLKLQKTCHTRWRFFLIYSLLKIGSQNNLLIHNILSNYVYNIIISVEGLRMKERLILKNDRVSDPYLDRRSGDDKREVYDSSYFGSGGIERRKGKDRRQQGERRDGYVRVSKWSSVSPDGKA